MEVSSFSIFSNHPLIFLPFLSIRKVMQKFGRLCACPSHSSSSVLTICSKRSEIPLILSPHSRIGFPLNAIRFIAFCPIAPTDKTSNSNQASGKSSNPTAGGDDRLFREQVEALRREIETEQKAKKQKPLNRFQKAWRKHREKVIKSNISLKTRLTRTRTRENL